MGKTLGADGASFDGSLRLIMILCWMIFNAAPHMWLYQTLYTYTGIMKNSNPFCDQTMQKSI